MNRLREVLKLHAVCEPWRQTGEQSILGVVVFRRGGRSRREISDLLVQTSGLTLLPARRSAPLLGDVIWKNLVEADHQHFQRDQESLLL